MLKARIYGNTKNDKQAVHRPGWINKTKGKHYFAVRPDHYTHSTYTTDKIWKDGDLTTYNIVLAGFEIDKESEKLPIRVLEALEC